jgi:ketosteroid isomerase-like protein
MCIKYLIAIGFAAISLQLAAQPKKEQAIREIIATENDFAAMAVAKGLEEAFAFYAADDAVIKRGNDSLIKGKTGIRNFYADPSFKQAVLLWSPDFADAAASGDLGYTVGKYSWKLKDSAGNIIEEHNGVFHSVWKKQQDGSWKFVWD